MVHYPIDFPADSARVIVTNFRGNIIVFNRVAVVESAWNLIGYGLSVAVGSPPELAAALQFTQEQFTQEQEDERMVGLLESHDALPAHQKPSATPPIPVNELVKWALSLAFRVISGAI